MKLIPAERILLINQNKILKILNPDKRDYHEFKIEMFENGYEENDFEED
ncbi:MAG: YfbU family protein [Aestuariivita sp.]|nr:YfbU family protein [Aestuariivita sp.]